MKKRILFFYVMLFCTKIAYGQCLVSSLVINTGYDPVTGLAIAGGANGATPVPDPHWLVTTESPAVASAITATPVTGLIEIAPGSNADIVTPYSGGWVSNPIGQPGGWISCLNSNYYYSTGAGVGDEDYSMTLSRPFRMCGDDSIILDFYIANDNFAPTTTMDGNPLLFSQPDAYPVTSWDAYTHFTQTLYLTAGTHTFSIVVDNYDYGYYDMNPTGLNIYGTISSATTTSSLVSETDPACGGYVCSVVVSGTCDTIHAPDSIVACSETPVVIATTLSGTDSIYSVTWTPSADLADPFVLTPTLSATSSGWYYVTVQSIIPDNFVTNGDFSAGSTEFSTAYTPDIPGTTCTGCYAVDNNPHTYDAAWPSMGDHTTGSGEMLIVDGALSSSVSFWCQSMTVTPNTNYALSFWLASTSPSPLPLVQATINGSVIGSFTPDATIGIWNYYHAEWNSGTSATASICLSDAVTSSSGNSFVIDDIALDQLCTSEDSLYVHVLPSGVVQRVQDTTLCNLTSGITLQAPDGYTSYLWSTGSTATEIDADTGIYWLNASTTCAILSDTFHVVSISPILTVHVFDTSVCIGVQVTLTATSGFTNYTWSNGETGNSIIADSGIYWSAATAGCSISADTFYVRSIQLPVVSLGSDTSICQGDSLVLSSLQPNGAIYHWNNGSTGPSLLVNTAGTYSVTVTLNGCSDTASVNVTTEPLPTVQLGSDTTLCQGDTLLVVAENPVGQLLWSTGDTGRSITVSEAGSYWVRARNACKTVQDTISVSYELCNIWFPNAFTPNGDGRNDIIRVVGNLSEFQNFSLGIYNRWGQRVFYTTDIYEGWDGKYNGIPQDSNTLFYMIHYSLNGKQHIMRGDLELIR